MNQRLLMMRWCARCFATAFWMISLAGCGGTSAPATADQDEARQTLDKALSSWKKGESVEALKKASPSILVSDPKWSRGDLLKTFEVEGPGKPSGAERAFTVMLWLTDAKGKEAKEQVVYKVGTSPVFTVFRSLF